MLPDLGTYHESRRHFALTPTALPFRASLPAGYVLPIASDDIDVLPDAILSMDDGSRILAFSSAELRDLFVELFLPAGAQAEPDGTTRRSTPIPPMSGVLPDLWDAQVALTAAAVRLEVARDDLEAACLAKSAGMTGNAVATLVASLPIGCGSMAAVLDRARRAGLTVPRLSETFPGPPEPDLVPVILEWARANNELQAAGQLVTAVVSPMVAALVITRNVADLETLAAALPGSPPAADIKYRILPDLRRHTGPGQTPSTLVKEEPCPPATC